VARASGFVFKGRSGWRVIDPPAVAALNQNKRTKHEHDHSIERFLV